MKIKAYYIKETDKPNIIKKLLNIIEVKNNEILVQQITSKTGKKHIMNIVKKINKLCLKTKVENVVLSKNIKANEEFVNILTKNGINIFTGRWLFKYITYETIEYILEKLKQQKENTEISILTQSITKDAIETIKLFSKEFKRVNIVTKEINKLKYLEKKMYDQYGILMTITNNKRKSLSKSKIILNFDFNKELLNQYSIYENAIIINIQENIKIKKKRFNGILVNNYEVFFVRENDYFGVDKLNDFYLRDLLEAKLYRNDNFINIRKDIFKEHLKIKELYGNNGTPLGTEEIGLVHTLLGTEEIGLVHLQNAEASAFEDDSVQ